MSETPATSSPTKETAPATTTNLNGKKFEGEGLPFKAKLIGMEDLSIDRDEKICLDSMFKLKAVVRARGEHKQKIQLNLTMSAVKVIDDATKAQIANHEIERISFVVIDPRDTRAFGYIYNTSDDRHQFWAIKTERPAAATVLALKELFELAFEQFTTAEKTKDAEKAAASTVVQTETKQEPEAPAVTEPTTVAPPSEPTVPAYPPPPPPQQVTPVVVSEPVSSPVTEPAVKPVVQNTTPSLFDDDLWGNDSSTPVPPPAAPTEDLFNMNYTPEPVNQPPPAQKTLDPLEDLFSSFTVEPTPVPTTNTAPHPLLGLYSNPIQSASQPVQANPMVANLYSNQPPTVTSAFPLQTQQILLSPTPLSPVAPPTVTSPFADFDFLGGGSSSAKPAKDLFNPTTGPAKTIQQMQMEKQP